MLKRAGLPVICPGGGDNVRLAAEARDGWWGGVENALVGL